MTEDLIIRFVAAFIGAVVGTMIAAYTFEHPPDFLVKLRDIRRQKKLGACFKFTSRPDNDFFCKKCNLHVRAHTFYRKGFKFRRIL